MTLYEGTVGSVYVVKGIHLEQKSMIRRLEALGVNDMTGVQIMNRKRSGACIIRVRGTRLAVGRTIAQGIEVEVTENHA